MVRLFVRVLCAAVCVAGAQPAAAQTQGRVIDKPDVGIDGPPAPVPPATISRDDRGQATVRAIRLAAPLAVDGRLDEDVYTQNPPFGELIQVVPRTGEPATERTDVWLMFD